MTELETKPIFLCENNGMNVMYLFMTDLTMYAFLYCLFMEFNNDV